MNVPDIFERMQKALKKTPHLQWIVLIIVAAVVVCLSLPSSAPARETASSGSMEQRLADVLSRVEGVGRAEVLINGGETVSVFGGGQSAPIAGVIVVAEGAESIAVQMEIIRAVTTLLDIPPQNVEIFPMAKK